jgi:formyltetrahydrofolate deformylase
MQVMEQVNVYKPDYLVLAKYMRILSANFVDQYAGRIINIHHSFLPAFIGANPYKYASRARARCRLHRDILVANSPRFSVKFFCSPLRIFLCIPVRRQAWERGVKIIGATAHFVTSNLDEGPIIAQVCGALFRTERSMKTR